ncbi:glycosyltransferase [Pseudacidovorax sp. NFM-22]|uniref:glycosyltransferase n=1 Tax=Pseudacidovorax sp. NFM-22 TaxID=2744469 RepID=UPI001F16FB08|nr:glycosyltransferase [Pseudacidovorax sp. NFM-22]
MIKDVLVIVVTHNSARHIDWCVSGLSGAENVEIRIIDSGSTDVSYLAKYERGSNHSVFYATNLGFVGGNAQALFSLDKFRYVLFLNPDARIDAEELGRLLRFADANPNFGVYTVPLIKFDIAKMRAEEKYDSLGIFCSRLGRWYDRRVMKRSDAGKTFYHIDAACGALTLVSQEALLRCLDSQGKVGFESTFHMYKEDIEYSLRAKSFGYQPVIFLCSYAFHCRGWTNRGGVADWAKRESAKNDVFIAKKYRKRNLPFALLKKALVSTGIF